MNLQDMIREMPSIPKAEKRGIPQANQDFLASKALISSVLDFLQKQLPQMTLKVQSDDSARLSRDIMDLQKTIKSIDETIGAKDTDAASISTAITVGIESFVQKLSGLEDLLSELNSREAKEIEFPSEIKVSNFPKEKEIDLSKVIGLLEDLNLRIASIKNSDEVRVSNLGEIKFTQQKTEDYSDEIIELVSSLPESIRDAVSSVKVEANMSGVVLPPTPGNVVRENAVSSFKALSGTSSQKLFANSTKATRIDITVTGGPVAVGFDENVSSVSGSENGVMLYPANVPYSIYIYDLSKIYVAGATGRRVCYNYFV